MKQNQFAESPKEDVNKHLKGVLTMCTSVKVIRHTEEGNWLIFLPFSLIDDSEEWYEQGVITLNRKVKEGV